MRVFEEFQCLLRVTLCCPHQLLFEELRDSLAKPLDLLSDFGVVNFSSIEKTYEHYALIAGVRQKRTLQHHLLIQRL